MDEISDDKSEKHNIKSIFLNDSNSTFHNTQSVKAQARTHCKEHIHRCHVTRNNLSNTSSIHISQKKVSTTGRHYKRVIISPHGLIIPWKLNVPFAIRHSHSFTRIHFYFNAKEVAVINVSPSLRTKFSIEISQALAITCCFSALKLNI